MNLTNQDAGALELRIDSLAFDAGVTSGVGISFGIVSRASPGEFFLSPVLQLTAPIEAGDTIVVPFSDFMSEGAIPPNMAELSEIASLSLMVDGGAQSEFSLSFGELRTIPMAVPEPGLTASLMAGMIGLVTLRRRRQALQN